MIVPKIEFPIILEKPGNPYKWVPLHPDADTLNVPNISGSGGLYLFTFNGDSYHVVGLASDAPLVKFSTMNFTHWFTKPLRDDDVVDNHICPILMEHAVEYLVCIKERWHFSSAESLLRDNIPIKYWVKEKDLFPIR